MDKFLIRCSSLADIMTEPKTKAAKDAGEISETAKSAVQKIVRQHLLGYDSPQLGGKEIKKGLMQEQTAINLLNDVFGTMYVKNTQRYSNEWITGEPDIDDEVIEDIKCSWSKDTFPLTSTIAAAQCERAGYSWQMRGYMMLRNKPQANVRFCLVDTPSELVPPWEEGDLHNLAGIPLEHRVTTVTYYRDEALELRIRERCEAAQRYANQLIEQFLEEHKG